MLPSSSRQAVKSFSSALARSAGPSQPRPSFLLPSASSPEPKTPSPPPSRISFEPDFFSSIPSLKYVRLILAARRSKPPEELALYSETQLQRHEIIDEVLTKAARILDDRDRRAYFRDVDLKYAPRTELEWRRKEARTRQLERSGILEKDALRLEQWDAGRRARRESSGAGLGVGASESSAHPVGLKSVEAGEMTVPGMEVKRDLGGGGGGEGGEEEGFRGT
ncbi:hypothetical protein BDY24DRAFT_416526 [Mrakia frigida]|uniref:uncharacterized protein n=1 Tax=Mrakia frigida TaxID=29902 RepID=UPI003FCC0F23